MEAGKKRVSDRISVYYGDGQGMALPDSGWILVCCLSGVEGVCRILDANQPAYGDLFTGQVLVLTFDASMVRNLPDSVSKPLNSTMLACIQSILKSPFEGIAGSIMLEARCLELLALYLTASAPSVTTYRFCKTEYDRERLAFARDYLLNHNDLPTTIPELARIAGINEFKLKNGFRELFGSPIHRFILGHKLEIAADALRKGEKSPGQLAFDLGFSSLQHFSKAFKNSFGVAPVRIWVKNQNLHEK